jgi:hypothetical protein
MGGFQHQMLLKSKQNSVTPSSSPSSLAQWRTKKGKVLLEFQKKNEEAFLFIFLELEGIGGKPKLCEYPAHDVVRSFGPQCCPNVWLSFL